MPSDSSTCRELPLEEQGDLPELTIGIGLHIANMEN
jgi:hypothetical protein